MRIFRVFSLIVAIVVILSVSAFAEAPVITAQPQDYFFPAGTDFSSAQTAYFSVMATGDNLSYQWQSSLNGGAWANVDYVGNKTPTLNALIYNSSVNGKRLFRCVLSNDDGSVVSQSVSVSVGAYVMDSIPQMLAWGNEIINSIFDWIGNACACIIDTPLLLIGVSFFALGASIAILSRLLSRS